MLYEVITLIGQKVIKLWLDRKRGVVSSSLHIKLVGIFGAVATIPVIVVSVFSALFFNVGIRITSYNVCYTKLLRNLKIICPLLSLTTPSVPI